MGRGRCRMARTKRKTNPLNPAAPAPVGGTAAHIYRAGGYIRLSVEDSGRPGADTVKNQEELVTGYIAGQPDMELRGLYCDNGETGTDFGRPGFDRLMGDVKAGEIDCIVVKDLSRFGRNYRETGNYLERIFPFLGVRFVAVSDHFDTLTAQRGSDGYVVPLKNIINEVYSRDISRKSGTALAVKQKKGDFIGTWAAYGYRKRADNPHRIEPDEETAPVVRDIFKWRMEGMGYAQIARKLNRAGIPSPSRYHYLKGDTVAESRANVSWCGEVVKNLLANEVYLGHTVQGRKRQSFYEGKRQMVLPESEWTVVRDTHEALIDMDTFRTVQEIGQERKVAYRERIRKNDGSVKTPNILMKLVFCADCGRPMVRYRSAKTKTKGVKYFFICRTHAADPQSCPKKYMPETDLHGIVWETLQRQLALAGEFSERLRRYRLSPKAADAGAAVQREEADAEKALKRAQNLYDSLYPMYAEEKALTEGEYMRLKQEYREEIRQAGNRLDAARERKRELAARMEENPWIGGCSAFSGAEGLTEEMAHALISRIEIGADNTVSITLRYRDEYRHLAELLGRNASGGGELE